YLPADSEPRKVYRKSPSDMRVGVPMPNPDFVSTQPESPANPKYLKDSNGKLYTQILTEESRNTEYEIHVDGDEFNQPWFEGGHPDELVKARIKSPMTITVFDNGTTESGVNKTHTSA